MCDRWDVVARHHDLATPFFKVTPMTVWTRRLWRPLYYRLLSLIDRLFRSVGDHNPVFEYWLKSQKDRNISIYWEPRGFFPLLRYLIGRIRHIVARVASFESKIIRTVTYYDGEKKLFSVPIDLTEYTQDRYYLRFPDAPLRDLIVSGGEVFVDVGANIGIFTLLASQYFSKVYAFEPLPPAFEAIKANVAHCRNVILKQVALSNSDGKTTIYQNAIGMGGSSLHPFSETAPRLTNKKNWNQFEVQTARIDSVLGDLNRVDLVKIDVEGHEVQVIAGALEFIRRNRPILYVEIQKDERFKSICMMLPDGFSILDPYEGRIVNARPELDTVFFWPNKYSTIAHVFPNSGLAVSKPLTKVAHH